MQTAAQIKRSLRKEIKRVIAESNPRTLRIIILNETNGVQSIYAIAEWSPSNIITEKGRFRSHVEYFFDTNIKDGLLFEVSVV